MTADSLIPRAQAAALALMVDACTMQRPGTPTTDPETGYVVPNYTLLYTGRCRVQRRTMFNRPRDTGEAFITLLALEVQLPITVTDIQGDDVITITAALHDSDLVGRVFHVRGFAHRTHPTKRVLNCLEVGS